jgi:predicted porin
VAAYSYAQFDYVSAPSTSGQGSIQQPVITPPVPPGEPPPVTPPGGGDGNQDTPKPESQILTNGSVDIHSPTLSLVRSFDELTKGSLDAGYTHYLRRYSNINNYQATLTLNRSLNEVWSASLTGGARYTDSQFRSVQRTIFQGVTTYTNLPPEQSKSWGWIGRCALNYNGLYSSGGLTLNRDLTTGGSSTSQRTAVNLEARHRFSEELSGSFSGGYSRFTADRGEFAGEAAADSSWQFAAGLRYDFNRDIALDGGYSKLIAKTGGQDVGKNYLFVNLTIRTPFFR